MLVVQKLSSIQVRSIAMSCKTWGLLSLIKLQSILHLPLLEGTKQYYSLPPRLKFRYPQAHSRLKTLSFLGTGCLSAAGLTRLWPMGRKVM